MGSEMSVRGALPVCAVVRAVITEVAPGELTVVAGLERYDDAVVVRRLRHESGQREPLGFGLGEIEVMATPVVWLVLDQTAREIGSAAANGASSSTRRLLRRVLRRRAEPTVVPPLTSGQLAEVHRRILEMAARRGLENERAEALADAVVTRLTLTTPAPEPDERAEGGRRPLADPADDGDLAPE
ncbi:hypothetical protein AB0451_33910 [Streptomyces sp. NPDC052000]|uniref:hypothetical protein n=1 Tax=Streptomyces sp. NPDC052000 TaxID=3155676 RepID=UPI00344EB0FB